MGHKGYLHNSNFYLLFSVLAIVACVGFLYKIQDGVLISPRYIESGAEVEREIDADSCIWTLVFDKVGEDQAELNKEIKKYKNRVERFFEDRDIDEDDMEFGLFVREEGRAKNADTPQRYRMGYRLVIKSKDLPSILKIKNDLAELYRQNITFSTNRLEFRCSLNDKIKSEMTAEVAKKAMEQAHEIADALDSKIVRIWRAYEPNFQTFTPDLNVNYGLRAINAHGESHGDDDGEMLMKAPKRKVKAYIKLNVEIK